MEEKNIFCKAEGCNCCKEHEIKENKIEIILYIISIAFFAMGFLPILSEYKMWMYFISVIVGGYELILEGIKNIFHLNFEEDTLMTIAIIAAFIIGEFPESAMVVILYKLGEFIEEKAVDKSNNNIKQIVEIKAKKANLLTEDGSSKVIDINDIKVGDNILIKPRGNGTSRL